MRKGAHTAGGPPRMSPPGGETKQCKCGYIHPPPWGDDCPMVQGDKIETDEKSQSITKFCQSLASFLHGRNDYQQIIDKFTQRLKI